jgi:hypothetical protein
MEDYNELVRELNFELFEKFNEEPDYCFSYLTDGTINIVLFGEEVIYNDSWNTRVWDGRNYEPLKPFIKEQFNKYITNLQKYFIE